MWLFAITSNIGKLYIVGNHFSPWVWIRDLYLKIRFCLARINCQSFPILHGNTCHRSRYFHHEWNVPSWRGSCTEHYSTKDRHQKWSLTGVWTPFLLPRFGRHRVEVHHFVATSWMPPSWGPPFCYRLSWFSQCVSLFVHWSCLIVKRCTEEGEREWERFREKERERYD